MSVITQRLGDQARAYYEAKDDEGTIRVTVYAKPSELLRDTYVATYHDSSGFITVVRATHKDSLIWEIEEAEVLGKIRIPIGFELGDAIDACEEALFGGV